VLNSFILAVLNSFISLFDQNDCLVMLAEYFLSLSVIRNKMLVIDNIFYFLLTPQTILIHIY